MLFLFLKHSWRYFGRHKILTLLNIGGIALGIAVFVSVQIVNRSALQSFRASVDLVSGRANLELVGDGQPFDERIYPRVRSLPGLAAVTPYVEATATLVDYPGEYLEVMGLDLFSNEPFRTFNLRDSSRLADPLDFLGDPQTLALNQTLANRLHLKLGDQIRVQTDLGSQFYKVRYLMQFNQDAVGANEHLAVMDIANVQENFGLVGRLTRISCRTTPQASWDDVAARLRAFLPADVIVQTPERRGHQVDKMLGAFQLNLTALSLVSLLVGMFLIYNTVSAAVIRRRTEIGLLRALGLTGGEVRLLFLGEAFLLGLFGLLTGLAIGVELARILIGQVSQTISSLYILISIQELFFSPYSLAATVGLGLGATLLAAWFPATEAARIPVVEALQSGFLESSTQLSTGRWLSRSALCAFFAFILGEFSLHGGPNWLSFGCALMVLLSFALAVPRCIELLAKHWKPARLTTRLALNHFGRSLHRNAVTIAALVTALAMLVGVSVMIFSFRQTVDQWLRESVRADLFIADASNLQIGARKILRPEIETAVAAQPELETYDTYRELRFSLHGQACKLCSIRFPVAAQRNPLRFLHNQGSVLFAQCAAQDAVVVSEAFARKFQVQPGQSLLLPTPDGLLSFRIAGIFTDYTTEMGLILMDRVTYQKHWHDFAYNSLALYLKPNTSVQKVQERLQQVCAPLGLYLIYSNQQLRQEVFRIFDQTFRITYLLQTVALLVSGLGIFLNLIIMIAERRREIGVLRAIGAKRQQLFSLILQEAALIGALGAALGLPAGLALAVVLSYVINIAFFGWTIDWACPWGFLLSLPFSVIATALLAGYEPARQAASLPIAAAVKME